MGWLTEDAARRRAKHYRDAQQREWEASSAVPRVPASGPSSRVVTPVSPFPALFIGGPWDGKRQMMEYEVKYYNVAVMQKVGFIRDNDKPVPITHEQVQYTHILMGNSHFYIDSALLNGSDMKHPIEVLMLELSKGYRNL